MSQFDSSTLGSTAPPERLLVLSHGPDMDRRVDERLRRTLNGLRDLELRERLISRVRLCAVCEGTESDGGRPCEFCGRIAA